MSGSRIPIISKRTYDFSNGSGTVVAVKAVDVTNWREGVLLVRIHSQTIGSGSTMDVIAKVTAPSSEEPSADFVNSTEIAKVSLTNSTSAPSLLRDDLVADFGAFLQITVVGTLSAGSCTAEISAELVLKT